MSLLLYFLYIAVSAAYMWGDIQCPQPDGWGMIRVLTECTFAGLCTGESASYWSDQLGKAFDYCNYITKDDSWCNKQTDEYYDGGCGVRSNGCSNNPDASNFKGQNSQSLCILGLSSKCLYECYYRDKCYGNPGPWTLAGFRHIADISDIAVGYDGDMWIVDKNDIPYHYNIATNEWDDNHDIPGTLNKISVGSSTRVWGLNSAQEIFYRDFTNNLWGKVSGSFTDISASYDGAVWCVNSAQEIYYLNWGWIKVSGALVRIAVGSATNVWGINENGNVYKRNFVSNSWTQMPGNLKSIDVSYDNDVWGINVHGNVYRFNHIYNSWTRVCHSYIQQIAVGAKTKVFGFWYYHWTIHKLNVLFEHYHYSFNGDTSCLSTNNFGCHALTTKNACLASEDGRDYLQTMGGFKVYKEPCIWCGGERCTGNNYNKCEPKDWLLNQPNKMNTNLYEEALCINCLNDPGHGCDTITTEDECLLSKDGRSGLLTVGGYNVYNEPCVHCIFGCTTNNGGTKICEARDWLLNAQTNKKWEGKLYEVATCSDGCDETISGDGSDYRGCQQFTTTGNQCQKWSSQTPWPHVYTPENYADKGIGDHNYCRNPNGHRKLWCFTNNPGSRWEECRSRMTYFRLKNKKSGKCIYSNSATFTYSDCSGLFGELWTKEAIKSDNTYFRLKSLHPGNCIVNRAGISSIGTPDDYYFTRDSCVKWLGRYWKFQMIGSDGYFQIQSEKTGLCIYQEGNNFGVNICNEQYENQFWTIEYETDGVSDLLPIPISYKLPYKSPYNLYILILIFLFIFIIKKLFVKYCWNKNNKQELIETTSEVEPLKI